MNPHEWHDPLQRLHGQTNHQGGWDSYYNYSSYSSSAEPHNRGVGHKELSRPSHSVYSSRLKDGDPDGEPLEILEEDAELERKRKRLREIEEQIIYKKASLALKTIGSFVKEATPPGDSCNKQPDTLKNRVNTILLQRHSPSFLPRARSQKERRSTSSLQECHPLQLRVKALMKQRHRGPCVFPTNTEVPGVALPHPSQSVTQPEKKENGANQGFMRFLSVLNKGVDIEFLSRIVNDDSEEVLNLHPSHMDSESNPRVTSERHALNTESSLQSHSWTNSADRKTDSPSREQPFTGRPSLPDPEEETDRRGRTLISRSGRSESPVAVKKKKKEEGENSQAGEQNQQLQNILKTLGLSLETRELDQLADRTQMRLYGKRHEGRRGTDRTPEQRSQERVSHRDDRKSPRSSSSSSSRSSSSSSSSSKLTARSLTPSPSRRRRSRSRHSDGRRKFDHSPSGGRDELQNRGKEEAQTHTDRAEIPSTQVSAYYHQYPQMQTFLYPPPVFPDYRLSEFSHYTNYSSSCNSAAYSPWTHANSQRYFPSNISNSHPSAPEAVPSFFNPDLSESEGQVGSTSASRCLKVISTVQSARKQTLVNLTRQTRRRNGKNGLRRARKKRKKKWKAMSAKNPKQLQTPCPSEQNVTAPQDPEGDSTTKELIHEKRDLTEEEIKANLRKKLEAFNQKSKLASRLPHTSVVPPASSLTSEIS
ncbi:zinc finger protein 318-like isoform X1 [Mugil cephalus]|uniref:zinc finger protein 318-like isoform X1 n=1 Tax=Mugil cephalus TaxID=48193 RepID=UPI001FB66177|nr:zinc finger protein 318-like isoform X1 [Mugil cephalus]XP_047434173.1 zinc finger protein 318-like isoform X1 [Mugil cephalus]XP_047434174.1 zinc finger protein 318-like isoform X1 [Mugil cephalus]